MKTTIKKTIEEVVEIQLPYFFKTAPYNVALISETEAICVCRTDNHEITLYRSSKYALEVFHDMEKKETTEDEFLEAYGIAMDKINHTVLNINNESKY